MVRSLGILHHLTSEEKPAEEIDDGSKEKMIPNPQYNLWLRNNGLLTSWLLGTMKEEVLSLIFEAETATAHEVWTSLESQLLPITVEKEGHLKSMLMKIKKGSRPLNEYLREFKSICDNLAAIKKPISDLDKVFQFSQGLGPRYENFSLAMLAKPPYPSFAQFVLSLQGHEQGLATKNEEETTFIEHAQAFFGQ